MKIKLKTGIVGNGWDASAGDVVECGEGLPLSEEDGQRYCERGMASKVAEPGKSKS